MNIPRQADAGSLVMRSTEPSDATAISALFGQIGTLEGLLHAPDAPITSRLEYLQKVDPHSCKLVALISSEIVGSASLHAQPFLRRVHTRTLGMGISPPWQGRGIGRKLLARLLDWADNWAGVLRVELQVHADNERALRLYESMGFVLEGRHQAFTLKNGRYVDALSMARLHPNPPKLPS